VVIATEQYVSRLMVPQRRSQPSRWSSHKAHAAKALKKLAGPYLPGSLRQLENAVKRAHEDCARAERESHEAQQAARAAETEGQPPAIPLMG
jgi:DNA-binding NtrC family response regulator